MKEARERSLCPKLKVRVSFFGLIAWNRYWTLQKIVSAYAFIFKSIDVFHYERSLWGPNPWLANMLFLYEWGKDCSLYCRETVCHMS